VVLSLYTVGQCVTESSAVSTESSVQEPASEQSV